MPRDNNGIWFCNSCGVKGEENFYKYKNGVLYSKCKNCKVKDKREWRKNNPEKVRNQTLKRRYGITIEEYDEQFSIQDGKCAICLLEKTLVVDHCHNSDKVRGLLCNRCNGALGNLGDTIEGVSRALSYIKLELDCQKKIR